MIKRRILLITIGILISASICAYGIISSAHSVNPLSRTVLEKSGIEDSDKLMIVAHPDDEVLWGGGHIMEGNYFLVCITNGRNDERKDEFKKVLEESGNRGIILEYPDKVLGLRDSWSDVKENIKSDIETIIDYKDWKLIATHNPHGEYGHKHHIMTSEIVTEIFKSKEQYKNEELWYFGEYHRADDIEASKENLESISSDKLEYKENLEEIYISQNKVVSKFAHMNPYEMWEKYDKK